MTNKTLPAGKQAASQFARCLYKLANQILVQTVCRFLYHTEYLVFLNARSKLITQSRSSHYYPLAGSYCHQSCPHWFPDLQQLGTLAVSQYSLTTTLNAWENTLRHDCGLHIAHVHKNPCGSRNFPNQALLFLNCKPISFFAASFFFCYLLYG